MKPSYRSSPSYARQASLTSFHTRDKAKSKEDDESKDEGKYDDRRKSEAKQDDTRNYRRRSIEKLTTNGTGTAADMTATEKLQLLMTRAKESGMPPERLFGFFGDAHAEIITQDVFVRALTQLAQSYDVKLSSAERVELFKAFDVDHSGTVEQTEFVDFCLNIPSIAWKAERVRVQAARQAQHNSNNNTFTNSSNYRSGPGSRKNSTETITAAETGSKGNNKWDRKANVATKVFSRNSRDISALNELEEEKDSSVEALGQLIFAGSRFFWRTKQRIELVLYYNYERGFMTLCAFYEAAKHVYAPVFIDYDAASAAIPTDSIADLAQTLMMRKTINHAQKLASNKGGPSTGADPRSLHRGSVDSSDDVGDIQTGTTTIVEDDDEEQEFDDKYLEKKIERRMSSGKQTTGGNSNGNSGSGVSTDQMRLSALYEEAHLQLLVTYILQRVKLSADNKLTVGPLTGDKWEPLLYNREVNLRSPHVFNQPRRSTLAEFNQVRKELQRLQEDMVKEISEVNRRESNVLNSLKGEGIAATAAAAAAR